MLKLYKRTYAGVSYWEAWADGREVTVHHGTLGTQGETHVVRLRRGEDARAAIEREAQRPRSDGFAELDDDDLNDLVIQYRLDSWGTPDDLETRHALEDILDACLGWTGNGHCDGGDIGSGTINVYALVVEPTLAVATVTATLGEYGLLDGAVIAVGSGDDYTVVFPPDFNGAFSLGAGPN
jgi:hypothetical protein